ncbi:peptidoglycan editing factor PgeF [Balneolaceae bacterium ANBcel3]|nr:peptidoglycan editing factor PgeF [Balneolaceae bacterium ANBcel3]
MIFQHHFPEIKTAFITKKEEPGLGSLASFNHTKTNQERTRVLQNNTLILQKYLSLPEINLAMGVQVHSAHVVKTNQAGYHSETDGLITRNPGLAIGVLVADCAAVYLYDPHTSIIGILHAGWRGALGRIVPQGIQLMKKEGALPQNIQASLSPCISQQAFETGEEVASRFPDSFIDRCAPKPHIDLKGFIVDQMLQEGLQTDHIHKSSECTFSDSEEYHSYRRDGDKSGRMLAAICLQP